MYLVFLLFGFFYFLIYQNVIGGCLLASLFVMFIYSYIKGRRMIRYVDISFNKHKKVYRQGEKFQLIIEVPKQRIFETREIFLEIQYTSIIKKQTKKVRETLLLQRRTDGKVAIEYLLKQCDCLEIRIEKFYLRDLCGFFHFRKDVNFYEKIYVLPQEYEIENGEISDSVEEYGNLRLAGEKWLDIKVEPVLYLDLKSLIRETDLSVRTQFLPVVYSISSCLLKYGYQHLILFGTEQFMICGWEDYLAVFIKIFDLIRAQAMPEEPEEKDRITHAVTTGQGLPVKGYFGKTIAVIRDEKAIVREFVMTEYVRANNVKEDIFYLSL